MNIMSEQKYLFNLRVSTDSSAVLESMPLKKGAAQ
jgi:hypothetical protein